MSNTESQKEGELSTAPLLDLQKLRALAERQGVSPSPQALERLAMADMEEGTPGCPVTESLMEQLQARDVDLTEAMDEDGLLRWAVGWAKKRKRDVSVWSGVRRALFLGRVTL